MNIARETRAKIKCDCNKIIRYLFTDYEICVGKKDNVEFHYNCIWFLLSFLARYSKECFKRPAALLQKLSKNWYDETSTDVKGKPWNEGTNLTSKKGFATAGRCQCEKKLRECGIYDNVSRLYGFAGARDHAGHSAQTWLSR